MELICYFCISDPKDGEIVNDLGYVNKLIIVEGRSCCLAHLPKFKKELAEKARKLRRRK